MLITPDSSRGDFSETVYWLPQRKEETVSAGLKHWAGFSFAGSRVLCLKEAGRHFTRSGSYRNRSWSICQTGPGRFSFLLKKIPVAVSVPCADRLSNAKKRFASLEAEFKKTRSFHRRKKSFRSKIHQVEHHRSHLGICFFLLLLLKKSAILSIDGFGRFLRPRWQPSGREIKCRYWTL